MNRLAIAAVPFALVCGCAAAVAAEPSPLGLWARGDGRARVRIEPCGAALCAVNTWIREGTPGEKAGDKLVMKVAPSGPRKWSGTAFDPQRDLSYGIRITVAGTTMTTSGCILAGLLCKDMGWTRLAETPN